MSPRGSKFKNNKKFKGRQKNKPRKPQKPKYNLSSLSKGKRPEHGHKRKKVFAPREPVHQEITKNVEEEYDIEDEEEEEDDMKQLLSTFPDVKNTLRCDSEEDTSEEEEIDDKDEGMKDDEDIDDDEMSAEENSDEALDEEDSDDEMLNNDTDDENESLEEEEDDNEKTDDEIKLNLEDNETEEEEDVSDDEKVDEIKINLEENPINSKDPFDKHLTYELNNSLLQSVQATPITIDTTVESWPELGRIQIEIPKCENENKKSSKVGIDEDKIFAERGTIPQKLNPLKSSLNDVSVKMQIQENIRKFNKSLRQGQEQQQLPFTRLQAELFSVLNNYQDLYYPERTFENAEELRFVYCVHALNHILKTRLRIIHHNSRLSKKDDVPEDFRDQGLVRPKVLIIAPFRDSAYKIINNIINILLPGEKGNVMNKNRFVQEFTGDELYMPKKNPKPEDYEKLFTGNTSDDFKIGITVTKKSLKLYADFYSSDIIISSPLGLRPIIGAEGEPERDYDFLASIELLILDQTEVFLMQNWDHVLHILNHMHLQPKDTHGTDFSRVRTWSLNGWAKFYRQTLIFSSLMLPEIKSIFNKKCFNYAGKVRVVNPIQNGAIGLVYMQLPHVYHKFECKSVSDLVDARFNFFINKILPQQRDALMRQTLIYVPNYFDYVRVRNYFKKEDISFVQICEYSKEAKVARARDIFFHSDAHFLLYTERFHFFNRKRIKGIKHLVFYQPPNFPRFYYEMCNLMQEASGKKKSDSISNMTVTVMYSKYDAQQLAAIVGTERAMKMVSSDKNVHMLVTD